jgi:UDP-N-acetylmuramoylalanine--D-glutamate ligase
LGHDATVCDRNEELELPEGVARRLGVDHLKGLEEFDLLIRTPILHPRDIVAANPERPDILSRVTTVTNEFMKVCSTRNIIGVTGTKGKGTTSTLIAKMLEAAGKRVHLGGNIGIPPLDMLKNNIQPDDWVVLELANFQLIDLARSPAIGVCLMVVPEHLNWHTDMDEYVAAKQGLFRQQTPDNLAIYNGNNALSEQVVAVSPARKLAYEVPGPGAEPHIKEAAYVLGNTIYMQGTAICNSSDVALRGRHNLENVCAAISAVWGSIEHDTAAITSVVTSFTGLEHRLELVREANDVRYYDDSFGTTPETAIVAMQAFSEPKVVILGGSDKGAAYDVLAQAVVQNNVRAVVIIGETGPAITTALKTAGYENIHVGGNTMPDIVKVAASLAQPGDVVLLSTGCASFGLFKNYKDRGERFKQAVQALA